MKEAGVVISDWTTEVNGTKKNYYPTVMNEPEVLHMACACETHNVVPDPNVCMVRVICNTAADFDALEAKGYESIWRMPVEEDIK